MRGELSRPSRSPRLVKKDIKKLTYGEIADNVTAMKKGFSALGLTHKHIALIGSGSAECIKAYMSAVTSDNAAVPHDSALPAEGTDSVADLIAAGRDTAEPQPPKEDDVSMIVYTSGTTGKSKGVMLTQANLYCNIEAILYDEDGFLFINGRVKNLIILSNGENISPEEIETKLALNDLICEIVVTGEDNLLTARIFPEPEAAQNKSEEELRAALQAVLDDYNKQQPTYKQLSKLVIRKNPFFKNSSKKIIRTEVLRDEA